MNGNEDTFSQLPKEAKFATISSVNEGMEKTGEEPVRHEHRRLTRCRGLDVDLRREYVLFDGGGSPLLQETVGEEVQVRVIVTVSVSSGYSAHQDLELDPTNSPSPKCS